MASEDHGPFNLCSSQRLGFGRYNVHYCPAGRVPVALLVTAPSVDTVFQDAARAPPKANEVLNRHDA